MATPMEDHTEGAQSMCMSVLQYNVRMIGWKELITYCEDRHGKDNGDGEVGDGAVVMEMAMWMWM